jgi:hypothetical protein
MATTMQLADLMTAVRQRADMLPSGYTPALTGSYFVTEPELISYINQSAFELYDILVQALGADYFIAPTVQFQTDGASQSYALPNGVNYSGAPALYKLLGVDVQAGSASQPWVTLKPFQFSERNRGGLRAPQGSRNIRYRLSGSNLLFEPLASAGMTIQLWYVPRLTPMALLTDTLDGISGWTEYVIVDAAIKCAQKEESDVSVLIAQKQALLNRITSAAENRDAGSSFRVADTLSYGGSFGYGDTQGDPFDGWV